MLLGSAAWPAGALSTTCSVQTNCLTLRKTGLHCWLAGSDADISGVNSGPASEHTSTCCSTIPCPDTFAQTQPATLSVVDTRLRVSSRRQHQQSTGTGNTSVCKLSTLPTLHTCIFCNHAAQTQGQACAITQCNHTLCRASQHARQAQTPSPESIASRQLSASLPCCLGKPAMPIWHRKTVAPLSPTPPQYPPSRSPTSSGTVHHADSTTPPHAK